RTLRAAECRARRYAPARGRLAHLGYALCDGAGDAARARRLRNWPRTARANGSEVAKTTRKPFAVGRGISVTRRPAAGGGAPVFLSIAPLRVATGRPTSARRAVEGGRSLHVPLTQNYGITSIDARGARTFVVARGSSRPRPRPRPRVGQLARPRHQCAGSAGSG